MLNNNIAIAIINILNNNVSTILYIFAINIFGKGNINREDIKTKTY